MKHFLSAIRILSFVFCSTIFFCSTVFAQDAFRLQERIDGLIGGYWISAVDHDAGAVVLRFERPPVSDGPFGSFHFGDGKSAKLSGVFRPARSGRWETAEGTATLQGNDSVLIEMKGQDGAKITLRRGLTDQLNGNVSVKSGRSYPVAFARTTLPQIHRWIAENPTPAARAKKDSVIELLYVTAADCPYCRMWEGNYLHREKPKQSLAWNDIQFSELHIGSFRARFTANDFPLRLRPAVAQLMKSNDLSRFAGTPSFFLFVNGEIRCYGFGTNTFETLTHPAIRAALREKSSNSGT